MFGLLIPLTGPGPRATCYVAGSAVVAAGIVSFNIIAGSFRQAYCPAGMLGRVTASMRFCVYGGIPAGALLAGGLATAFTVRGALWVVLAANAAAGLLLLTPAIRAGRDLPPRPPGE
jgi:hypothetical protein